MRVLLVGNYAPDRQYSMLGFADALRRELPRQGVDVAHLSPSVRLGRLAGGARLFKWAGYVDKLVLFRRDLRRVAREADLVHILDQGNALWLPWIADRPHLVTVHDLLALRASLGEIPGWTLGRSGRRLQGALRRGLGAARHTAAVSETTRADFRRLYPGSAEPGLISNGLYRTLSRLSRQQAQETLAVLLPFVERPFLLHLGGNPAYKNRIGAVRIHRAMRRLDPDRTPRLVLAGQSLAPEIRAEAEAGLRNGTIVEVVRPTDAQVSALYSLAEGLVFPSLAEGFGLPILEAQTSGCPVFASDRAPLPEVGGDGAIYFDPTDAEGAARRILDAWHYRPELVAAGHRNVDRYDTTRMAEAYARTYAGILAIERIRTKEPKAC